MERNRRIGKAYARVPIVTIDGSHELSYDGYKLALNGFDNPDRDSETEECRKRIGKGIRIKMDNFGNILIKRLSKSGVYIKEWISSARLTDDGSPSNPTSCGRTMPSRQQLIKNQNALLAAASNGGPKGQRLGGQVSSSSLANSTGTPTSSSSGGSSIESPNDSAVCDEVLSVGGRLELDKIYVMFDMKKFQANITQELCQDYPDRRKLEQQCFSIVGLSRDTEADILNLACWVMVINIVALEMLNERFPMVPTDHHPSLGYPETMLSEQPPPPPPLGLRRSSQPSFVSIFDQQQQQQLLQQHPRHRHRHHPYDNDDDDYGADRIRDDCLPTKEEDPYTLPANASSSDVKSSINDYGTTSTKHISSLLDQGNGRHQQHHHGQVPSRYYGASKGYTRRQAADLMRRRSKSNYDIYGPVGSSAAASKALARADRYHQNNNSSSIYSPGHMLVPPPGDSVPPKLPPRDFVHKKVRSKSSSSVNYDSAAVLMSPSANHLDMNSDMNSENIYSIGQQPSSAAPAEPADGAKPSRKGKKNRFLESLKAPLDLAKSGARSASVMGAPVEDEKANNKKSAAAATSKPKSGGFTKTSAKNLRSFLGVGGKSSKETAVASKTMLSANDSGEADSVVDPNEEELLDDSQQVLSNHSSAANSSSADSYNDLDIPTPDYETDENIYGLEENGLPFDNQHQLHHNNHHHHHHNHNHHYHHHNNHNHQAIIDEHNSRPHQHRARRYSSSQKESRGASIQQQQQQQSASKSTSSTTTATGGSANNKNNKDDLYYSGFRAHIPKNATSTPAEWAQNGKSLHGKSATTTSTTTTATATTTTTTTAAAATAAAPPPPPPSASATATANDTGSMNNQNHINNDNNNDKMSCLASSAREKSRYLGGQTTAGHHRMVSSSKLSGRDMIYGSTSGIAAGGSAAAAGNTSTGSRYRSASMQRLYPRSSQQQAAIMSAHHRSQNEMYYGHDAENPYAMSSSGALIGAASSTMLPADVQGHYGVTGGGHRRRPSGSKPNAPGGGGGGGSYLGPVGARVPSSLAATNYDIGRSSSGIYGNHSGSSSSDYADWHPQMRKVNSSGYLNSIFSKHPLNPASQLLLDPYDPSNPLNNNNNIHNNNNNTGHAYNINNNNNNNNNLNAKSSTTQTGRNHTSRTLKSMGSSRPAAAVAAGKQQQQLQLQHQVASSVVNGPTYRSYDSSNDSEPSYTNSSDGLDIYDQIGAHSRLNHHSQFLASHAVHNLAPEIHVGEWEKMYDR